MIKASRVSAGSRARAVSAVAKQQKVSLPAAAATLAASLVLTGAANAGVVLEQPQLKKVFQADSSPAAPAAAGAKAAKAPAPKKKEAAETSSGGISPQAVALPAALVFVGGGAFALTRVDPGFGEFMETASCKDSGDIGAGYETALKGEGGIVAKKGTIKVKKSGSQKGKN